MRATLAHNGLIHFFLYKLLFFTKASHRNYVNVKKLQWFNEPSTFRGSFFYLIYFDQSTCRNRSVCFNLGECYIVSNPKGTFEGTFFFKKTERSCKTSINGSILIGFYQFIYVWCWCFTYGFTLLLFFCFLFLVVIGLHQ